MMRTLTPEMQMRLSSHRASICLSALVFNQPTAGLILRLAATQRGEPFIGAKVIPHNFPAQTGKWRILVPCAGEHSSARLRDSRVKDTGAPVVFAMTQRGIILMVV